MVSSMTIAQYRVYQHGDRSEVINKDGWMLEDKRIRV